MAEKNSLLSFKSLLDAERKKWETSAKKNTDKIERGISGDTVRSKNTKTGKPFEEHMEFNNDFRRTKDVGIKEDLKKNDQTQFKKGYYNPKRKII